MSNVFYFSNAFNTVKRVEVLKEMTVPGAINCQVQWGEAGRTFFTRWSPVKEATPPQATVCTTATP